MIRISPPCTAEFPRRPIAGYILICTVIAAASLTIKATDAKAAPVASQQNIDTSQDQTEIDLLTKKIANDPKDPELYLKRGEYYAWGIDKQKAISDFSEAIRLKPDFATAYISRANSYKDIDDYESALRDYSRAIELDPANASYPYHRARLYMKQGEKLKALEDYSISIQLRELPNILDLRADLYMDLKQYDKAIADFSRISELVPDPGNAFAEMKRGHCYFRKKEYENALKDYMHCTAIRPNDYAYVWCGHAYLRLKEYDKAIENYSTAIKSREIKSSKRRAEFYAHRANAYMLNANYDAALADCREAIRLKPDEPKYKQTLSFIEKLKENH